MKKDKLKEKLDKKVFESIREIVATVVETKRKRRELLKQLPIYKSQDDKTLEQIKKKCNSKLTDIVTGPMDIYQLNKELVNVMYHRSPEYLIILMEKRHDLEKYQSAIYVTHEDFKKYN